MGKLLAYIEDPTHVMKPVYLPDEIYMQAITAFIIVCVDVIIIDSTNRTFWLPKRRTKPYAGVWNVGGRRFAGEKPESAIRRCFLRETGLDVSEEHFRFITIVEYQWNQREQEPQNAGSHNIAHQFVVELTPDERAIVITSLDETEYVRELGLQELNRERLAERDIHQFLRDLYDMVFPEN